jgi:hypothetical protein
MNFGTAISENPDSDRHKVSKPSISRTNVASFSQAMWENLIASGFSPTPSDIRRLRETGATTTCLSKAVLLGFSNCFAGIVNLGSGLTDSFHEQRPISLPRTPLPSGNHQLRCVGLSSFCMRFRDVEDLLAERRIIVSGFRCAPRRFAGLRWGSAPADAHIRTERTAIQQRRHSLFNTKYSWKKRTFHVSIKASFSRATNSVLCGDCKK